MGLSPYRMSLRLNPLRRTLHTIRRGSATVSLIIPPRKEKKKKSLISPSGRLALETPKKFCPEPSGFSPHHHHHHVPHISVRARYWSGSRSTNMQCQEWPGCFVSHLECLVWTCSSAVHRFVLYPAFVL